MRVRVRVRGFGAAHGHAEDDDERAAGRCRRRVCSGDFGGRELQSKSTRRTLSIGSRELTDVAARREHPRPVAAKQFVNNGGTPLAGWR